MTETERKALAWINQVAVERGGNPVDSFDFEADVIGAALIRAIKQHEADRAELVAEIVAWLREEANGWMCADMASSEIEDKWGKV